MSGRAEAVRGLLRKAESDLRAVRVQLDAGASLDVACFHAQQAAEKHLKALLLFFRGSHPFTHNLEDLVLEARRDNPNVADIAAPAASLAPYAVEARYDNAFWPDHAEAQEALQACLVIREEVRRHLPPDLRGELPQV